MEPAKRHVALRRFVSTSGFVAGLRRAIKGLRAKAEGLISSGTTAVETFMVESSRRILLGRLSDAWN